MAGHEGRHVVERAGRARSAHRLGIARHAREVGVGDGRAAGHAPHRRPCLLLEGPPGLVDRHLEERIDIPLDPCRDGIARPVDVAHLARGVEIDMRDVTCPRLAEPRGDDNAVLIGHDAHRTPRGADRRAHEWCESTRTHATSSRGERPVCCRTSLRRWRSLTWSRAAVSATPLPRRKCASAWSTTD